MDPFRAARRSKKIGEKTHREENQCPTTTYKATGSCPMNFDTTPQID